MKSFSPWTPSPISLMVFLNLYSHCSNNNLLWLTLSEPFKIYICFPKARWQKKQKTEWVLLERDTDMTCSVSLILSAETVLQAAHFAESKQTWCSLQAGAKERNIPGQSTGWSLVCWRASWSKMIFIFWVMICEETLRQPTAHLSFVVSFCNNLNLLLLLSTSSPTLTGFTSIWHIYLTLWIWTNLLCVCVQSCAA